MRRLTGLAAAAAGALESVASSVWLMEENGPVGWRHAHSIELHGS